MTSIPTADVAALADFMARQGFLAADDEAAQLTAAAGGDRDRLQRLVERRLTGEPLAWITGTTVFCGETVRVAPGVYVPRPQSEIVAHRAAAALPPDGLGVDVCTGSGAIAVVVQRRRPRARVIATDIDAAAVACARDNGVEARVGHLLDPVAADCAGITDVVVAVVPYVPTAEMEYLQRDTFTHERPLAYDGGEDGLALVRGLAVAALGVLRPGGHLIVEIGGTQDGIIAPELEGLGYRDIEALRDEDGDLRAIDAVLP